MADQGSDQNFKVFQSSRIHSGRYNPLTRTLTLWFSKGQQYDYLDVPPDTWDRLKTAMQPGVFLRQVIEPNFRWRRIADN